MDNLRKAIRFVKENQEQEENDKKESETFKPKRCQYSGFCFDDFYNYVIQHLEKPTTLIPCVKIEQIKEKLKAELKPQRYEHTMHTVLKAMELAVGTEADMKKVFIASLLHDCAKYRTPNEEQEIFLNRSDADARYQPAGRLCLRRNC